MAPDPRRGGQGKGVRGILLPALITAALGLLLRILYLASARGNPFWNHLGLDMAGYDRWARAVLAGHGLGEVPFTQAPLFPLLLSAVYAVLGPDPVRALWAQVLPGSLAVFLSAYAAGRWKGPAAAWAAGICLALYKPAIFYTGVLLPPAWVLFLAALCLMGVLRIVEAGPLSTVQSTPVQPPSVPSPRSSPWPWAAAGLAFGLLALAQPAALAAAIPAAWVLVGRSRLGHSGRPGTRQPRRRTREGRAEASRHALPWFASGVALPLLLAFLYNGIGGRAWSTPAVNGGINLYIGNGPEANGGYVTPAGIRQDQDLLGISAASAALGSPPPGDRQDAVSAERANAWWTSRALDYALSHPLRSAGLYLRKLLFFFGQYEIPQVESLPFERRYSWILRVPLPGMALLTALGLFAALLLWREPVARWLAMSTAVLALGVSVFFVTARFRIPAAPFLVVLGAGGIAELRRDLRGAWKRRGGRSKDLLPEQSPSRQAPKRFLLPAAIALAAGGVLGINLTGIQAKASEGQYHFRLGVIAEEDQRPDDAIREYQEAVALDPSLGKAEVNWGTLLARRGDLPEARAHLERGIALDPLSAIGLVNLGQLEQLQGRPEGALASYTRAIGIDPGLLSARESAALLLYESGRPDEAREHLEFLARTAPPGSAPSLRAKALLGLLNDRASLPSAGWKSSRVLLRADLKLAQGDAAGAAALYRQAAADPQASEAAGKMLQRLGR